MMDYKNNINAFYSQYQHMIGYVSPNNSILVGWSSEDEQYNRFQKLIDIGIKNNDTVLDYGCGIGHLLNFLIKNDIFIEYKGIDINTLYITIAKNKYPDNIFELNDITEVLGEFDWVIGSGVFSYGLTDNQVLERIDVAYKKSKKGVAFNFLDDDHNDKIIFNTYKPENMKEILVGKYGNNNVEIISGYCDNDFTVYIKK